MMSSSKHSTEMPYSRGTVHVSSKISKGRIETDRRSRKGSTSASDI